MLATSARAEDAGTSRAREHYKRGTTLFDLARYPEAAREYEAAYEIKNDPALLFNIGQAYRMAREYEKAITAYKSFLRRMPQTGTRAEVEARIAEMQKLVEEKTREAPPLGTQPPEKQPEPPPAVENKAEPKVEPAASPAPVATSAARTGGRTKIIAGAAVAGAGVLMLAVGGAMLGVAAGQASEIENPPMGYVFNPATASAYESYTGAGIALLGVGGAALVAGAVVVGIGVRDRKSERPSVAALQVRFR